MMHVQMDWKEGQPTKTPSIQMHPPVQAVNCDLVFPIKKIYKKSLVLLMATGNTIMIFSLLAKLHADDTGGHSV